MTYDDVLEIEEGVEDTNSVDLNELVRRCEEKHPVTCKRFKELQVEDYKLFCKKQLDYGSDNVTQGEDISTEDGNLWSLININGRCVEKVMRLKNLLRAQAKEGREPNNESIDDSFQDLSNYSLIARLIKEEVWSK